MSRFRNKTPGLALGLALSCLLVALGGAKQKPVIFPGAIQTYLSADGRFELFNVDPETTDAPHSLFIRRMRDGQRYKLLDYGRSVEALWSPTGSNLLLTDRGGSDYSDALIFLFGDKGFRTIHVGDELDRKGLFQRQRHGNHHVYVEGREWIGPDSVKVKIRGYGEVDPRGFTIWIEYKLPGDVLVLRQKRGY